MRTKKIEFASARDEVIVGLLDEPEGGARGWALFAHCFTCSKNLKIAKRLAERLAEAGLGLLRCDFTGLGESGGDFATSSFTTNLDDLRTAARWLGDHREAPSVLIGHSLGGAAVLAVASEIESARCVATIGAPSDPAHVRALLGDASFDESGRATVSVGGRPFEIDRSFVEDLERHDLAAEIGAFRQPLMIFHSPVDAVVGIEQAETIYKAARHPKSFVSLGGADHLLTDDDDAAMVGRVLAAWAVRYLAGA